VIGIDIISTYEKFFSQFVNTLGSLPHSPAGSTVSAFTNGNPAMDRLADGRFVPARFPYIVYEALQPPLFDSAFLHVSVWDRDLTETGAPGRPNFYGRINDITSQILSKIPPENGLILPVGSSRFLQILRGNVPFQLIPTGENDPTFVRIAINLTIFGIG